MAFQFVAAANTDNAGTTSITITKPTGTADNDILFAFLKYNNNEDLTSVPSGWAQLGTRRYSSGAIFSTVLYWKLAASEGADYTFSRASSSRMGGTIVTYRDGFATGGPIDVVSDTAYFTSDTTVRAASMSVTAANSPLLYFGVFNTSTTQSFSPPSVPTAFAEDVDFFSSDSRSARTVASVVWAGSGATGNMDATASATQVDKHAYAVALNPFTGGGGIPRAAMYYNRRD
jgi:hypothetical protein